MYVLSISFLGFTNLWFVLGTLLIEQLLVSSFLQNRTFSKEQKQNSNDPYSNIFEALVFQPVGHLTEYYNMELLLGLDQNALADTHIVSKFIPIYML